MNIPVVYEDEWLLVVDKPAGLLTIPSPRNEKRTLTSILNDDLKERGLDFRLHPCHRLDRDTSGLVVYAKGKSVQKKIMDEFKVKNVAKKYIAFVQGAVNKEHGEITRPIEHRPAITRYRISQRKKGFTVLEVIPLTGRTNQIRIHLKGIGHPIVGETKFAFRKDFLLKAKRLCLHAQALEFRHPVKEKKLCLSAALPEDLKKFLDNHE